jgi:uncharacterized protein
LASRIAGTSRGSEHLEPVIAERLGEEPVVVLTGARTVGKSTLLAACSRAHGVPVIDLHDIQTRQAAAADPALFASGTDHGPNG